MFFIGNLVRLEKVRGNGVTRFDGKYTFCAHVSGRCTWDRLFETPNFFAKYRHFIVLEASSACEQDQLQWEGLVESKVRFLILRAVDPDSLNPDHLF
jgi:poly(A) polymerase Pap1